MGCFHSKHALERQKARYSAQKPSTSRPVYHRQGTQSPESIHEQPSTDTALLTETSAPNSATSRMSNDTSPTATLADSNDDDIATARFLPADLSSGNLPASPNSESYLEAFLLVRRYLAAQCETVTCDSLTADRAVEQEELLEAYQLLELLISMEYWANRADDKSLSWKKRREAKQNYETVSREIDDVEDRIAENLYGFVETVAAEREAMTTREVDLQ